MRRVLRFALPLSLLICAFAVASAAAQTPTAWTAWLYNPNGTMTRIASVGAVVQEVSLPTVPGQAYPARVAVSRDGQIAAYVTYNQTLNTHRLVLYSLSGNAVLGDYITGDLVAHSLEQFTSPLQFDETGSAFGYGTRARDGVWRVLLLNTADATPRAELRSTDASAAALGIAPDRVPVVTLVQGGVVAFTLLDAAGMEQGSYLWDVAAATVRANGLFPGLDADLFTPTGEVVVPARDPSLPNTDPLFGGAQENALVVFEPASGRRFPFYNAESASLGVPRFVQNGERVLVAALGTDGAVVWRVLDRDGANAGDIALDIADVFSLADGFLYLTPNTPATLMLVNTRDGVDAGVPLGQSAPDARIQLAWAGDSAAPVVLVPTPAWRDLLGIDVASVPTYPPAGALASLPTADPALAATIDPALIAPLPTLETPLAAGAAALSVFDVTATQLAVLGVTATPSVAEVVESGAVDVPDTFYVAPTPVFIPTRESFQTQLQVGMRAVVMRPGHGAGLRTDPQAEAPAYILLYTDMVVDVLDGPNITDGYIWWRVRAEVQETTYTGWAVEGANGETWLAPFTPISNS